MLLAISDDKTIGEIQEKFNESFPLLTIEFYKRVHPHKIESEKHLVDPDTKIGAISKKHFHGELTIMSWFTEETIEREFKELLGLEVKLFKRENGMWMQTNGKESRTLSEQQNAVQQITSGISPEAKDQMRK